MKRSGAKQRSTIAGSMRAGHAEAAPHRTRAWTAPMLAGATLLAFAIRVLPAYRAVFAGGIVKFQEGDAWFHMRTVHNLLAHFPFRSGFDPYALYPGGGNVPTAPVWDYLVATIAWLLGLGSPSPTLVDRVGAYLPALLGALFPIPAYYLGGRYFGRAAASFAALWMAAASGAFLWITHLGLADHHAAEGLFAFLTLLWMCSALDGAGERKSGERKGEEKRARWSRWLGGIALGLFLATRPVGIFIPGILGCIVLVDSAAAPAVLGATSTAAVIFVLAAGSQWSQYTWLALALTGGLAAGVMAAGSLARRQNWPPIARRAVPCGVLAAALLVSAVARPALWASLWFEVQRTAGFTRGSSIVTTVQELQPIYRAGQVHGWISVFGAIGVVWIPALAGLALLLKGKQAPGRRLLVLWSLMVAVAGVMEVRMAIYFIPVAAVLAGGACGWVIDSLRRARGSGVLRSAAATALAALLLAVNLVSALPQVGTDRGPSADWRAALSWLRANSPEPAVDAGAWANYYPRQEQRLLAPTRWGVAVWWDFGYWVEQLAHRIPMANGTQAGALEMARFYTETNPEAALGQLRRAGGRYVIVDPETPLFIGANQSHFPPQLAMLGLHTDDYARMLLNSTPQGVQQVPVYLPAYYQTMAARLFLSDGEGVAGTGPWIFRTRTVKTRDGKSADLIISTQHFATETEATDYQARNAQTRLLVGCLDPGKSCVDVTPITGIRQVFTSDPRPVSTKNRVRAVKIFEVLPE